MKNKIVNKIGIIILTTLMIMSNISFGSIHATDVSTNEKTVVSNTRAPMEKGLAQDIIFTTNINDKVSGDAGDEHLVGGTFLEFRLFYEIVQGTVQEDDYIVITIPKALEGAKIGYPEEHFSKIETSKTQWKLFFKEGAESFISGFINIRGTLTKDTDKNPSLDIEVNDKGIGSTPIKRPPNIGGGYPLVGKSIISDHLDADVADEWQADAFLNGGVNGIKKGDKVTYQALVTVEKTLTNVEIIDQLPEELELDVDNFDEKNITFKPFGAFDPQQLQPMITKTKKGFVINFPEIKHTGNTQTKPDGTVINAQGWIYIRYDATLVKDPSTISVLDNKISLKSVEASYGITQSTYITGSTGASMGRKHVNKTVIQGSPIGKKLDYSFTFKNVGGFTAGTINFKDKLDEYLDFDSQIGTNNHFEVSYDELTHEVTIKNKTDILADKEERITFTVSIRGTSKKTGKPLPNNYIIKNTAGNTVETIVNPTYFKLFKKDKATGVGLGGAKFFVYQKQGEWEEPVLVDGNTTGIYTTDTNGIFTISKLDVGQYFYREINPPTGYQIDDKEYAFVITEEVDQNNCLIAKEVEVQNELIKKTKFQVTKIWDDEENQDQIRAPKISVNLLANGKDTGKIMELNSGNNWMGEFLDLDETDGINPIVYTIKEDAVNGYTTIITGAANVGFTITNTHVPTTRNINVSKVWEDNNDSRGKRPDNIVVKLYADGVYADKQLILSRNNDWKGVFEQLPVKKDNKVIVYSIQEESVAFYSTTISGDMNDGFSITNTYKNNNNSSLRVTKIWEDANDINKKRPEHVVINLYLHDTIVDSVILNESNSWTATFQNLPEGMTTQTSGYLIGEELVAGYDASYSQVSSEWTVKNTYVKATLTPGVKDDAITDTSDTSKFKSFVELLCISGLGLALVGFIYIKREKL